MPLCFAEVIIILACGYADWRAVSSDRATDPNIASAPPRYRVGGGFALANYLVHIVMPLGAPIPRLDFATLTYLPQYVSILALGAVAYRRDCIRTIPHSMGKTGFIAALAATIVLLGQAQRDVHPPQLAKLGLAAAKGVRLCFAVAYSSAGSCWPPGSSHARGIPRAATARLRQPGRCSDR